MWRTIVVSLFLLALGSVGAVGASSASAESAPVRLTFDKSIVDPTAGVWEGTTDGDVAGALRTELRSLQVTGTIWHVTFDWIVTAGPQSFTARLSGILNTATGAVVMNGTVIDGWLEGAQVHETGQLVDPAVLRFQGSIRLMPATG
jgi:hypothetical protein